VSAVGGRVEQLMSLIIHVRNEKKKKKSATVMRDVCQDTGR
jgi:hypothetical protein